MVGRFGEVCRELGVTQKAMRKAIEETFFLPYSYERRIKEGEDLVEVLRDLFAAAQLGSRVDENIKEVLGLEGFIFEDGDVDLFEGEYFFAYIAKGDRDLITYYFVLGRGFAKVILDFSVGEEKVERLKERLEELFIDAEEVDFHYEDGVLETYVELEDAGDLPRLQDLKEYLKGLVKI